MTPGAAGRGIRRRRRRISRRTAALLCAGVLLLGTGLFLGALRVLGFVETKSEEKFIEGGSGARYTPAGAAKRVLDKIRGKK